MNPFAAIGMGLGVSSQLMGHEEQARANTLNAKAAAEANAVQQAVAEQNVALQREFAQHGVRWKVEDARAAGIHPLYALGANTASFSPVSMSTHTAEYRPNTALSDLTRNAGQDLTRAFSTTQTSQERELGALRLASMKSSLQGQEIENQIKLTQLRKMNMAAPAMPSESGNFMPGQGNSPIKVNPSERVASAPGRPAQEASWVPDVGYVRTDTGLAPVPSKDAKERIEDQAIPEMQWAARNLIMPNPPPKSILPKGHDKWYWHHLRQEWQPRKSNRVYFPDGRYHDMKLP